MKQIHVLLAEDNDGDVYLIHEALRRDIPDYTLDLVSNGKQASGYLERLESIPAGAPCPDIFLLDLNLPGASGHELLSRFRGLCPEVSVVVITSSDAPGDIARVRQAGRTRYFRKPSDLDGFLAIGGVVREIVTTGDVE